MKLPTLVTWALALACVTLASRAEAQEEVAGAARGDYAWGEGGGGTTGAQTAEDPLRIMAFAGVGVGARFVRNLDPPFNQTFLVPPYFDLGAAVFLPGGDIRHGVSFYVSTNIASDVSQDGSAVGVTPGQQWALTPSYSILLPFRRLLGMEHDILQMQGRVGVPLVLGGALGGGAGEGSIDFTVGFEAAVALHIKFLAGFGAYVEAQVDVFGGTNDTVHPMIAFDAGLMLDYEVLP